MSTATRRQLSLGLLTIVWVYWTCASYTSASRVRSPTEVSNTLRHRASSVGARTSRALSKPNPAKSFGSVNLQSIRRGRIYAVNVAGASSANFHLVPVDVDSLDPANLASGAPGLSAHLRLLYPDANVGWAWYADTYTEDGWYRLEIRIDEDAPFPDLVKARAAGFVEGNIQGDHMYRYWTNYRTNEYRGRGEAPSQELYDFFDEQYGWMTKKVEAATGWSLDMLRGSSSAAGAAASASTVSGGGGGGGGGSGDGGGGLQESFDRRYWALVGLVAAQFEGLAAGFWASVVDPAQNMTWHELYTLNALGDLYELNVVFPPSAAAAAPPPPPPESPTAPEGAAAAAAGASAAPEARGDGTALVRQHRQRQYTPGHGEVGEYGYGELLPCSAIIKVDDDGGDDGSEDEDEDEDESDETREGENDEDQNAGQGPRAGRGATRRLRASVSSASAYLGRRGQTAQIGGEQTQRGQQRAGEDLEGQRREWLGDRPRRRVRRFWAAHNTWRGYYDMVRTWKVYDLPWTSSGAVTVSSSPGLLHSKDDWYTTDQFVVMETTNGIYNKALFDLIQPKCVLMWQRTQVANFGARSGSEWVDLFGRHNSGTYNNQWMVLDVPLLEGGSRRDVLWVLEQLPGTVVSEDATRVLLDQGYWASYNVPYFPEIYNLTGYPQPSIYATCPRARIFRREQVRVSSRSDLMRLMRLNHYTTDPASAGLPNAAIAARYDLPAGPDPSGHPQNYTRRAYGAVDAKISDSESFWARRTYVINGPTADDQPPFRWSAEPLFDNIRRDGSVDLFDFGWQAYQSVVGPPVRK